MVAHGCNLHVLAYIVLAYISLLQSQPLRRFRNARTAGLFTPYTLSPGGGEKYFLSAAKALQDLGYEVTILCFDYNPCKSVDCLSATAKMLGVDIDLSKVSVVELKKGSTTKQVKDDMKKKRRVTVFGEFDVFFALGNTKIPMYPGIGKIFNMYMCQYPFDLDQWGDIYAIRRLASYDTVILNSYYSLSHFYKFSAQIMIAAREVDARLPPSLLVVYPPTGSENRETADYFKKSSSLGVVRIAMLGRFFRGGRQNKGHKTAIATFSSLVKSTNIPVELVLMGNLQPGFDGYIEELKSLALGLPVVFKVGADNDEVGIALSSSLIFWHMTGIDEPANDEADPASMEHFGISVVEAMSLGCVPIVLSRGGVTEIVTHNFNGFQAESTSDYVKFTLDLLQSENKKKLVEFQERAVLASRKYGAESFFSRFKMLVVRGTGASALRGIVRSAYAKRRVECNSLGSNDTISPAHKAPLLAVIVEGSMHSHLRYSVCNAMRYLGTTTPIEVHYSRANKFFVRDSLRYIGGIKLVMHNESLQNVDDYNSLFKSPAFWTSFHAEKVLIFQTDSVFLRSGIQDFLRYDYIGAPFDIVNNPDQAKLVSTGVVKSGIGNGGLSLRNVGLMTEIASKYAQSSPNSQNEDVFFAHYVESLGYDMPTRRVAYNFSREEPCSDLAIGASALPLSLHAAWYYHDRDEMHRLTKHLLP